MDTMGLFVTNRWRFILMCKVLLLVGTDGADDGKKQM